MKKYLLIWIMLLASLVGQTNLSDETVEQYYNQPFDYYINENGYIVIRQPKVVFAKFKLVEDYFMPQLDHCYFNDIMLDMDVLKIEMGYLDEKLTRSRRRGRILLATGIAGGLVLGILTGKAFYTLALK